MQNSIFTRLSGKHLGSNSRLLSGGHREAREITSKPVLGEREGGAAHGVRIVAASVHRGQAREGNNAPPPRGVREGAGDQPPRGRLKTSAVCQPRDFVPRDSPAGGRVNQGIGRRGVAASFTRPEWKPGYFRPGDCAPSG